MMTTFKNFFFSIALGGLLLGMVGCQAFQPKNPGELALENHHFLGLWDAYNLCMTTSNIQEMKTNLVVLESAPKPISLDDSPIPVPTFIKALTDSRSSRLAVDPRAMAASCSLHLAEVAQQTTDWRTAIQTFQTIVDQYPEPQYAFYSNKAHRAIDEFSTTRPVSFSDNDFRFK